MRSTAKPPLRHPLHTEMTVGGFLALLEGKHGAGGQHAHTNPSGAEPPDPQPGDHRTELLAEAEERFRCLFEHAPIGMALVAPDGRFLKVNRALCRITGYPETALLRTCFQDITHPDDLDNDVKHAAELLAGRRASYQIQKRYRHAGGRAIWARLSVSLVRDAANEPLYFVSQVDPARRVQRPTADPEHPPRRLQSAGPRSITGP